MEFILLIYDQICYGIHSIPFIFGTDGMNISLHSCQMVKKKNYGINRIGHSTSFNSKNLQSTRSLNL